MTTTEKHWKHINEELELVHEAYPLGSKIDVSAISDRPGTVVGYVLKWYETKPTIQLLIKSYGNVCKKDPNYERLKLRKSQGLPLVADPDTITKE